MKRFYFIAAMAIMAAACQKTEIQNEVLTPIGFSTEVGKQTRAIVDATVYPTAQPFAVYAYGHQDQNSNAVMTNVEVSQVDRSDDPGQTLKVWAATGTTRYYWPNDPTTKLNFYAYSPAAQTTNGNQSPAAHKTLAFAQGDGNGVAHGETNGLTLTNYVHENMYVDFMVATPVYGATYSDPDGNGTQGLESGRVPMTFNHQLTQVVFNVTTDDCYPGVTFTVNSIKLENIYKQGKYTNSTLVPNETYANGTWSDPATPGNYDIFPADSDNGAVFADERKSVDDPTVEAALVIEYAEDATTVAAPVSTTGVTMIPQDMIKATDEPVAGEDVYDGKTGYQMFEINYSIEGTGVATETVTKHVPFYAYDAASEPVDWTPNKKITYTVKIGLNEITFEPSVAEWTAESGNEYTFQQ